METSSFLLFEIIVLGLFLLGLISSLIYNSFKEKKISSFSIGIIGFLLIGAFPAWGLYINLNKYLTKPMPAKIFETCIDGENCLNYQDTIHLCHPSNKNTMCFTSIMSMDGETRQTDTCTICRRSFLDHDTHREHRYYEIVSCMNESVNYCYKPKHDNYAIMDDRGAINDINANIASLDDFRKIDVLHQ